MRPLLLLALLALLPSAANAMRVRNGDTVPHPLTLSYLGDSWTITLPPDGHINQPQPGMILQFANQCPFRTKPDEEYLIRKGVLTLNRRNCCGLGRSN